MPAPQRSYRGLNGRKAPSATRSVDGSTTKSCPPENSAIPLTLQVFFSDPTSKKVFRTIGFFKVRLFVAWYRLTSFDRFLSGDANCRIHFFAWGPAAIFQ